MTQKIPCQGKHREFGNFALTQGILFPQVVNCMILTVKDIAIFAARISKKKKKIAKLERSAKSVFLYVIVSNYVNWHRENLQLDRENTGNLKIQFEWVPWFECPCVLSTKRRSQIGTPKTLCRLVEFNKPPPRLVALRVESPTYPWGESWYQPSYQCIDVWWQTRHKPGWIPLGRQDNLMFATRSRFPLRKKHA